MKNYDIDITGIEIPVPTAAVVLLLLVALAVITALSLQKQTLTDKVSVQTAEIASMRAEIASWHTIGRAILKEPGFKMSEAGARSIAVLMAGDTNLSLPFPSVQSVRSK